MRRRSVLTSAFAIAVIVWIGLSNQSAMSVSSGAPEGRSGSPSDGATCYDGCHGIDPGTPTGNEVIGLSGLPVSGYVPGTTYDLTLSASGSAHDMFGFQISPQAWNGDMQGEWIAGTTNHIVGTNWLTHTYPGTAGSAGAISWDFQWIAPGVGTHDVNFYFAVLFANNADLFAGDVMLQDSVSLAEDLTVGIGEIASDRPVIGSVLGQKKIIVNLQGKEGMRLEVFDLQGRKHYEGEVGNGGGAVDLSNVVSNGTYVAVIRGNGFSEARKVLLMD